MPLLTLAGLRKRVWNHLDDNQLLYPENEVDAAVTEAVRVINLLTGYQQVSAPIPSVANRLWYDTPSSIVIPLRVSFDGSYLDPVGMDPLGQSCRTWTRSTTANTGSAVTHWVKCGLRKFAIWPADSSGGRQIMVTGVAEPAPLTQPTDTVNWNNDILSAFDAYAAFVLSLKESTATFREAIPAYKDFQKIVRQISIWRGIQQPMYKHESRVS